MSGAAETPELGLAAVAWDAAEGWDSGGTAGAAVGSGAEGGDWPVGGFSTAGDSDGGGCLVASETRETPPSKVLRPSWRERVCSAPRSPT